MSLKNISIEGLKTRISNTEEYIEGLKDALRLLPVQTFLGRLSLQTTLKQQYRRLEKLKFELEQRSTNNGGCN